MKRLLFVLCAALMATSMTVTSPSVEAKRLGAGKAAGMQRETSPDRSPTNPPPSNAAPNQAGTPPGQTHPGSPAVSNAAPAAAAAAAAPARRSWMGPVAGLAAGLGLAALASHFGFGEELANFMMMALLALVAVFVIRWLMKRFASNRPSTGAAQGMAFAHAGATGGLSTPSAPMSSNHLAKAQHAPDGASHGPSAFSTGAGPAQGAAFAPQLPDGANLADIERLAKLMFIRMQAANDAANVEDLRKFTIPELFASLQLDLHDRGSAPQQTDVMQLNAQVVDVEQSPSQWVVSVRFHGLLRESSDGTATPFDETWHLVRGTSGQAEWAVAGITPAA